ncbi:MAG: phosphoribosylamine--glycine ligase [Rhodothermia bacterium]|nr:phosphoribosylamine--glycine ligase [Rhodothermia bacterium]
MRILVVGSGGREHAICYTLRAAENPPEVFVAPGNAGTAAIAHNIDIEATDISGLLTFVEEMSVDLTIVGPEQPLVLGLADALRSRGFAVVGPSAAAAQLEGSKVFAKDFMKRNAIPTAIYRSFTSHELDAAVSFIRALGAPVVVKASGLAAGKGAIVCDTTDEAEETARMMLVDDRFGEAGREIVVEEFMRGEEASVFALCDGSSYVLLSPAQDHKRVGDSDTGPNTGGMGAYAPAPVVDAALLARVEVEIIRPTVSGLANEGIPYNGFLYVGLMIEDGNPRVVEYNCRLGDPEAQVLLPLLNEDFRNLMQATASGSLKEKGPISLRPDSAACVVLCSGGYPGPYAMGFPISGLEEAAQVDGAQVFHAGTSVADDRVVTSGGRVLGVTATGDSLEQALARAYSAAGKISFEGMFFRHDIGRKGLERLLPA